MTLSEEVEGVLHRAFIGAREAGHAIITPEHIALELILEEETAAYLERCGTDLVAVESRLRASLGKIERQAEPETQPNAAFQRVVRDAVELIEADGREHLMIRDLFVALLGQKDSVASAAIIEATREPQAFEELRTYRSDAERGAA
jgi:ATP-dependent Clp protease ATP-binding subunit ClpA